MIVTGNPVRRDVTEADRQEGYKKLGLDPMKKTLLVFGGSRGARTINESMVYVEKKLAGNRRIQILHATGDLATRPIWRLWEAFLKGLTIFTL